MPKDLACCKQNENKNKNKKKKKRKTLKKFNKYSKRDNLVVIVSQYKKAVR